MQRVVKASALAISCALAATFLSATPALANTIRVKPGESIQAAIDKAQPGDTVLVEPGTYKEILEITKSHIIVAGSGASEGGTVLVPPTNGQTNDCSDKPKHYIGICIPGFFGEVSHVTVRDFLVQGFPQFGMVAFVADHISFQHSVAKDDGEYGFAQFGTTNGSYLYNEASGAEEAGFYIGDSDRTDFVANGNIAHGNTLGLFARNSSWGSMTNNHSYDNCLGILFLAGAPGPARRWTVIGNNVNENNRLCQTHGLSLSGGGIVLAGADGLTLKNNIVWANQPSGDSPFAGGIVLTRGQRENSLPDGNNVDSNVLFNNLPADIVWMFGVRNSFTRNECNTSIPSGLCASQYHGEYGWG